uniref:Capsid protein n=1 Tax=Wenzhou pacific spadenose shark astrovirus 2 TaxID=2116146 RepID=A0A2P1GNB3_9VIRU|nr:capsid protein [Wenzhou pacific spadenose shark astrovirus 2]
MARLEVGQKKKHLKLKMASNGKNSKNSAGNSSNSSVAHPSGAKPKTSQPKGILKQNNQAQTVQIKKTTPPLTEVDGPSRARSRSRKRSSTPARGQTKQQQPKQQQAPKPQRQRGRQRRGRLEQRVETLLKETRDSGFKPEKTLSLRFGVGVWEADGAVETKIVDSPMLNPVLVKEDDTDTTPIIIEASQYSHWRWNSCSLHLKTLYPAFVAGQTHRVAVNSDPGGKPASQNWINILNRDGFSPKVGSDATFKIPRDLLWGAKPGGWHEVNPDAGPSDSCPLQIDLVNFGEATNVYQNTPIPKTTGLWQYWFSGSVSFSNRKPEPAVTTLEKFEENADLVVQETSGEPINVTPNPATRFSRMAGNLPKARVAWLPLLGSIFKVGTALWTGIQSVRSAIGNAREVYARGVSQGPAGRVVTQPTVQLYASWEDAVKDTPIISQNTKTTTTPSDTVEITQITPSPSQAAAPMVLPPDPDPVFPSPNPGEPDWPRPNPVQSWKGQICAPLFTYENPVADNTLTITLRGNMESYSYMNWAIGGNMTNGLPQVFAGTSNDAIDFAFLMGEKQFEQHDTRNGYTANGDQGQASGDIIAQGYAEFFYFKDSGSTPAEKGSHVCEFIVVTNSTAMLHGKQPSIILYDKSYNFSPFQGAVGSVIQDSRNEINWILPGGDYPVPVQVEEPVEVSEVDELKMLVRQLMLERK